MTHNDITTDSELLELAAKAAGLSSTGEVFALGLKLMQGPHNYWNPLINSGDALELAVKLGLAVSVCINMPDGDFTVVLGSGLGGENHNTDPYAATRRAIVRAAAEIGRSM